MLPIPNQLGIDRHDNAKVQVDAWLLTGNHLIHPVPKPGGIPVAAGPALLAGLLLFAHRDRCATLPR